MDTGYYDLLKKNDIVICIAAKECIPERLMCYINKLYLYFS